MALELQQVQKSFRIKHDDDKFLARLLSRETNPSFRLYYGGVGVPFTWETCPGTPKHPTSGQDYSYIPPLTPPPSYYNAAASASASPSANNRLHSLLLRIRKTCSSSSSSRLLFSDPAVTSRPRRCFKSWGGNCPTFEERRRGLFSVLIVKKALLSIIGRGSSSSVMYWVGAVAFKLIKCSTNGYTSYHH